MGYVRNGLIGVAAAAGAASSVQAQGVTSRWLTGSLSSPVYVTAAPGDHSRIFVLERRGHAGVQNRGAIRIYNLLTNTLEPTPFLTVNGVGVNFEQGLVCMAFDPNYASNGYFYITYTSGTEGGASKLVRYQVSAADPNVADPASAQEVMTIPEPYPDHNMDWIGFGPDGFLYITKGDGGNPGSGDPEGRAQNLMELHGKILRIDVSELPYTIPADNPFVGSTTAREEIWAYGVRNPWRGSFDRETGDFWFGDVGQTEYEEVNFLPAPSDPPHAVFNYGWRCYE
jgi:glucose/arabinose dehydrogenase